MLFRWWQFSCPSNCFVKKTQKTPKKEIKLAEKIKKEYLKDKNEYE